MPQYGSTQNLISQNLSQTVDNQGNPIISADTTFGASPLGYAARAQALFGLPNSTFELTPPDPTVAISGLNPLPYWDVQNYSDNVMAATSVYDSTTNSWGVKLDPGTATTNDYMTFTTRSYLINDDNLSLRQQALVVVSKSGTYAGTTQWNLQLTASYYDTTDTLLHSGTVATIYDNATWTSMAGTTTTSGTAISASAHYVDLTFKLTATAPVTSATSVTIKSCLLKTSTGSAGAQSFLVTETFTSSGTWTRPTGVNYLVAIVAVGSGGGGAGGRVQMTNGATPNIGGAGGGAGADWIILRDLYVGGVGSVAIGIGSGGAGGAGGTATKSAASTAITNTAALAGSNGATTTFGTYITVDGGRGGQPCGTASNNGGTAVARGTATTIVFGSSIQTGGAGGAGGTGSVGNTNPPAVPGDSQTFSFAINPYSVTIGSAGNTGGTANTVGTFAIVSGTAGLGGSAGFGGGGAGASGIYIDSNLAAGSSYVTQVQSGGNGGAGGAGQSRALGHSASATVTITGTAGVGGAGVAQSGAGGGGGGGLGLNFLRSTAFTAATVTLAGGAGGSGASGFITVAYIA